MRQVELLHHMLAFGRLLLSRLGRRGRWAETPADIPLLGWRDILVRAWRRQRADNVGVLAAGIAFFGFLALLPLIASIAMIYGLTTPTARVVEDVATLMVVLPDTARRPLAGLVAEVAGRDRGGVLALASAVLLTLYAAARGARSLIRSLNAVYGEEDEPTFVRRWALAVMLAVGCAGLLVLALVGIALFGFVEPLLPGRSPAFWLGVRIGAWLLVLAGFGLGSAALYRYAPRRRRARWRWIVPGAAAATAAWLVTSSGFGLYVANFARYDATYGSLAAVAILQLWLYLSAFILLLGATLNAEVERQTVRDTTVGAPRPRGQREAHSADSVGEVP